VKKSINKGGRPKTGWGDAIRKHPKVPEVLDKIFFAALDDTDDRQTNAWKLLMDRIAPQLKAETVTLDTDSSIKGVIVLPEKKPLEIVEKKPDKKIAKA
tara:strand:+ start:21127 stop:21423 length:297 start_codon:yes stop_codon:yes gene_type:complete